MKVRVCRVTTRNDKMIDFKVGVGYKPKDADDSEAATILSMRYNRLFKHVTVKWSDGDVMIFNNVEYVISE